MNIQHLSTFLAILETGSLARAAERLNVTQSTVTARLKALEQGLGQTLVERKKAGATPTASGVRLKRYAETITGLWRQARQETGLPTAVSSVCNIGCHPDLWPGLGRDLFSHIRTREPGAAISVWQGGRVELEAWRREGLADLILTYWPPSPAAHDVHELSADELILVATRADAPTRFDPGYVFVEAGDEFGRDHAEAYADAGTARVVFGSAMLGLEHVLVEGGSCYLPRRIAAPHLEAGRLFALEAPAFTRRVYLAAGKQAAAGWRWLPDWLAGQPS